MKNFINETQEIKGITYQEAKKITPEEFWRNEALQAALQQRAGMVSEMKTSKYRQDDNSINSYKSVFKKIKSGIPVQKAIDEMILEKGLSLADSEADSFQNLDSAVVSNKDNLQDKATISATADSILLLFREKKTGKMGVLRIYGNGTYELFDFVGLPIHPADQIVYSAPPVVQPASTPAAAPVSTPAPATSKNIAPYVYAGIGLIVILLIARMVTKK
jgi:hypothetical protein